MAMDTNRRTIFKGLLAAGTLPLHLYGLKVLKVPLNACNLKTEGVK
jgi:hypothetical protein